VPLARGAICGTNGASHPPTPSVRERADRDHHDSRGHGFSSAPGARGAEVDSERPRLEFVFWIGTSLGPGSCPAPWSGFGSGEPHYPRSGSSTICAFGRSGRKSPSRGSTRLSAPLGGAEGSRRSPQARPGRGRSRGNLKPAEAIGHGGRKLRREVPQERRRGPHATLGRGSGICHWDHAPRFGCGSDYPRSGFGGRHYPRSGFRHYPRSGFPVGVSGFQVSRSGFPGRGSPAALGRGFRVSRSGFTGSYL
jgi:hypothetical protein